MQRILITGSSGFIGSSLCAFLKNKDVPCLGVSRTQGNDTDILIKSYKDVIKYNEFVSKLSFAASDEPYSKYVQRVSKTQILSPTNNCKLLP